MIDDLTKIRSTKPLILNLTNFVAINYKANILLALGASPIMAHDPAELMNLAKICDGVCLNIGTLDQKWTQSFELALKLSKEYEKPSVLDPVGSGATNFRTHFSQKLLDLSPTLVKANLSETLSLFNIESSSKGVDSFESYNQIKFKALQSEVLNRSSVFAITGKIDYILHQDKIRTNSHGHTLMSSVTGMGCALGAVCSAFLAVNKNILQATYNAILFYSLAGEKAELLSNGPGDFQNHFINSIYHFNT